MYTLVAYNLEYSILLELELMRSIETEPAFLKGEIVAVSKTEDGGAEVVRWDEEAKNWKSAPDLAFGDVAFLAARHGELTDEEMKIAGITRPPIKRKLFSFFTLKLFS